MIDHTIWKKHLKASSLALLLVLSSVCSLLSPFIANATAPVDTTTIPVGWEDFVDAHRGTNIPANWRDVNYAVFQYDADPSTFIIMVGDNAEFALSDAGTGQTNVNGQYLCRWNTSLSGGPGCNPPNAYSMPTSKMYKMHLTPEEQATLLTDWPDGAAAYADLYHPLPVVKPDFTYSVNNKDVTSKHYNQDLPTFTPDAGYTVNGYSVEWSMFKCGSWNDVGAACSSPTLMNHQIQPQSQQYNFSVDSFADYTLSAQYLVQECYRYPSYPATPDNCFYVDLGTEFPDYNFLTTTVHLKIDGTSIAGDTKEGECDTSGYCSPPSPYEDCSTYGLDIGGYIGCIFRNFQVWFVLTLKSLFIPSPQFFSGLFDNLKNLFSDKLGFLFWPVTFLGGLFNALTSNDNSGVSSLSFAAAGGVIPAFRIDFGAIRDHWPSLWSYIQISLTGITVFGLVLALYHKYMRIVKA